jgi:hypothetical protein
MKRAPGTAKTKLMAVRHQHILRGIPDPLCDKQRVFLALAGTERMIGRVLRKLPVTPGMVLWSIDRFWAASDDEFIVLAVEALSFLWVRKE